MFPINLTQKLPSQPHGQNPSMFWEQISKGNSIRYSHIVAASSSIPIKLAQDHGFWKRELRDKLEVRLKYQDQMSTGNMSLLGKGGIGGKKVVTNLVLVRDLSCPM